MAPNTFQNYMNVYQPAQGAASAILAVNNFANPISFLCGAVQAASRLNAEQSAKLCVQYLAPIIKNRQYNFPPIGLNLFVGATARPNEITYSEEWMRPDYIPPQPRRPHRRSAGARWRSAPAAARAPAGGRGSGGHESRRRPAGPDGAARSRIMMRGRRIRLRAGAGLLALARVSGCPDAAIGRG